VTALEIRKGDEVLVIAGKDRGKQGRVTEVRPGERRVVIEGVNMAKRHRKGNPSKREQAGIIDLALPMDVAKVMVLCPHCRKPTRIGHRIEGDVKERICKHCGEAIIVTERE
jgi:large subunit ribosomal protein L24